MSGAHLLDLQATPACYVWWEADGIEPLARRDRVYGAATAPACPYLHFPSFHLVAGIGVEPTLSSL
jgi:hypothetical protein